MIKRLLKDKRGFTLIELLGVITILILVMMIAIPSINSLINRSNGKTIEAKKAMLEAGAETYVLRNYNNITASKCYIDVTLITKYGIVTAEKEDDAGNGYLTDNNGNLIKGYVIYDETNKSYTYSEDTGGLNSCIVGE